MRFFPYRYAPRDAWSRWGYAQSLERDVRVRPRASTRCCRWPRSRCGAPWPTRLGSGATTSVHAHWVVPNAALVADVVRAHGVPLVVSLHGSDVFLAERFAPARALARARAAPPPEP